jgi:hypothetical protein
MELYVKIKDKIGRLESNINGRILQIEGLTKPVKRENKVFLPYIDEYREGLILCLLNEIIFDIRLLAIIKIKVSFNPQLEHLLD